MKHSGQGCGCHDRSAAPWSGMAPWHLRANDGSRREVSSESFQCDVTHESGTLHCTAFHGGIIRHREGWTLVEVTNEHLGVEVRRNVKKCSCAVTNGREVYSHDGDDVCRDSRYIHTDWKVGYSPEEWLVIEQPQGSVVIEFK